VKYRSAAAASAMPSMVNSLIVDADRPAAPESRTPDKRNQTDNETQTNHALTRK